MITLLFTSARNAAHFERVLPVISGWVNAAAAVRLRRQTFGSLAGLDDRMLRDIGLNRSMLSSASIHGIRAQRDGE